MAKAHFARRFEADPEKIRAQQRAGHAKHAPKKNAKNKVRCQCPFCGSISTNGNLLRHIKTNKVCKKDRDAVFDNATSGTKYGKYIIGFLAREPSASPEEVEKAYMADRIRLSL